MTKWWPHDNWPLFFNVPSPRNPRLDQGCQTLHPPPPPQRPRTCSQTKYLANAAFTVPQRDQLCHDQPQPPNDTKQEGDLEPDPPDDIPNFPRHHIVPVIPNLRPQYPTKHEGMLEDPFPLIQSANAVTDPDTGKQL